MTRSKWGAAVLAAVLAAAVFAGCSSDDKSSATATTAKAGSTASQPQGPTTTGLPATAPASAPVGNVTVPPVAKGKEAAFGGGVTAVVTGTKQLDVTATSPGETSGPAVAATLVVHNNSKAPFDLGSIAVAATYGADGTPAIESSASPAANLTGSVPAGTTATGVYVFRVPKDQADALVLQVQSAVSPNVLQFKV